jgi:Spy/CpxP family protein refolding chaperone
MRKILMTMGILLMVGILAAPVFAHRWGGEGYRAGGGPGYGPCWLEGGDVTDGQRAELDKLQEQFANDTAKLREEIWNKSKELDTLMDSTNPDANRVKILQKEISDLQAKMADKRVDFELRVRKIAPDARFGRGYGRGYGQGYGRGYGQGYGRGYGMMGPHHGPYGHGGMHYGQGYGPCWQ